MDKIAIIGQNQLNGKVRTSGAKNSSLPLLFSTLLCDGKHIFSNVPQLQDIQSTETLLNHLGSKAQRWSDSACAVLARRQRQGRPTRPNRRVRDRGH